MHHIHDSRRSNLRTAKKYGANYLWILTETARSVTTFLLPEEG
jgi:hypothetical protein